MKKIVPIIIILLVVVGVVIIFTNKHSADKTTQTSSSTSNMPKESQSSSGSSGTPQATDKVTISNFSFSPSSITVKKGTTVTWTNQDSVAHTVVETDGKTGPNSQDLSKGQSYTFTYGSTGTFNYHCSVHPDMIGKVVVTD